MQPKSSIKQLPDVTANESFLFQIALCCAGEGGGLGREGRKGGIIARVSNIPGQIFGRWRIFETQKHFALRWNMVYTQRKRKDRHINNFGKWNEETEKS